MEYNKKWFYKIISVALVLSFLISSFSFYGYADLNLKIEEATSLTNKLDYEASLSSLINQINTKGIGVYSTIDKELSLSPSGKDFSIRISYEVEEPIYADYENEKTATVKFILNAPSLEDISFEYKIYAGSAFENEHYIHPGNNTIIFEAGQTEKQLNILIPKLKNNYDLEHPFPSQEGEFWDGDRIFYISCFNITNALFDNNSENVTVPVRIENNFDFLECYNSAKDSYLAEMYLTEGVSSFPDTPGKYINTGDIVNITTAAAITTDVRIMIETGVFSHLNLLEGYFLNDNAAEGNILFKVDKNNTWGPINILERNISINGENKIPFNFSNVLVSELGLGRTAEGNGIAKSLGISLDYSGVNDNMDIFTVFCNQNNEFIESQMNFEDKLNPYPIKVEAQTGEFGFGDYIPLKVTYNEPVLTDGISICANGITLYPTEKNGTISETVSFLYEVKDGYNGGITVEEIKGAIDVSGKEQEDTELPSYKIESALLKSHSIEELFSYYADTTVELNQGYSLNAKAEIKINIKENQDINLYLLEHRQDDRLMEVVKARVIGKDGYVIDVPLYANDGMIITELKGEFYAPSNLSDKQNCYVAEIYFDENSTKEFTLLYSLSKKYIVPNIVYVDGIDDVDIIYNGWPKENKISADSENEISLGYNVKNNATWQGPEDFVWSSSDSAVASITTSGAITLTGSAGSVSFTLTALNGGQIGKQFNISSVVMEVVHTGTSFLNINEWAKNIEITKGNNAMVYYSTNLTQNNAECNGSDTVTEYFYDLYETFYEGDELKKGALVMRQTAYSTVLAPTFSFTIDKQYLINTSTRGEYSYILDVSARDLKTDLMLLTSANICVKNPPARAKLRIADDLYITDKQQNISVMFDVDNKNSQTEVYLSVTKNNEMVPIFYRDKIEDSGKEFNVDINAVDKARLFDVYKISLKAKNEFDETYSYDSYNLFVYNSEALKIMINDKALESHTMSLSEQLSHMTSEELLNYSRNIRLTDNISINYNQYKWSSIYDKITWSTEDDGVLELNYNTSVFPNTKLLLEGIKSGKSYVTARHDLTGIEKRLEVTVEGLRDKLFIFQVYPAQKSEVRYINGKGENKIKYTDSKGRLAFFEKDGINGDVQFIPENRSIYDRFTLKSYDLKAKQEEINYLNLYPQNNIMFKASSVEIGFNVNVTDHNGSMMGYNSDILIKGGVYRNGVYCPDATINGKKGNENQIVSGPDYLYKLKLNPLEFVNSNETDPISEDDKIEYVFEINIPGDSYHPAFMKLDSELVRLSRLYNSPIRGTVHLKGTYESRIENEVNIISQKLVIDGKEQNMPERIIIEDKTKPIFLNTEMTFRGDYGSYEVKFTDKNYMNTEYTTFTEVHSYEFSDTVVIKNTFDMQQFVSNMELGEEKILVMQILAKTANGIQIINLPTNYKINQLSNIDKLDTLKTGELQEINQELKDAIKGPSLLGLDGKNSYVKKSLEYLSEYSIESDSIRLDITPTDNPLVFRGVIKIAVGELSKYLPSGVYSTDEEASSRYTYMPKYSSNQNNHMENSIIFMNAYMEGYGANKKAYGGGAYLDCEIFYDINDGEWKILTLKSFMHIGGGYHYRQVYNTWIGFVPVTAEFLAGGAGLVGLKTILDDEKYNRTCITELQSKLYIKGFGGVGRDYDIVSLKVGPYGKLTLDQLYLWLNSESKNSNGQQITVRGETGIEYEIKLVFAKISGSYEIGEASKTWTFNDFNNIKKIYNTGNLGFASKAMSMDSLYKANENASVSLEDRSYLLNERQWNMSMVRGLVLEDTKIMQTNAYPYSDPMMTADGEMMVYISDMNSTCLNDSAICFSLKSEGAFPEGVEIDSSEYADIDAVVDGTTKGAAVAWTRVVIDDEYIAGADVTANDIKKMTSGTEIMASIYDGTGFSTTRLTDNSIIDMSPVVASDGRCAIVSWRSLYAGDIDNPLDFDGRDNIMYRVFDESGWSEEKCLYDGSIDKVRSLNVKMLSDGTSAVVYEVEIKDTLNTEIYCAIVDKNGDILNNLRLTSDEQRDENPRITSVEFPDKIERFVIGWNTEISHETETQSLIRITAVDKNGNIYNQFENEIEPSKKVDYSSFKFVKGAKNLEDLSIVWAQPDFDSDEEYKYYLWGRKFIQKDFDSISISPEIKLLELDEYNAVDFFDACIGSTENINFTIQVTDYNTEEKSSKLVYANTSYLNKVYANGIYYPSEEILPEIEVPIVFRLYNGGIEPIEGVGVSLGGTYHEFGEGNYIMPGEYKDINVPYTVPLIIENPDYIITAKYPSSVDTILGKLNIDVPDVGIYGIDVVKEAGRERMFSILIHNKTFSKLKEGKHEIKLYAYNTADFTGMPIAVETISDAESFNMINDGVLIKNFLLDEEDLQGILNEDGEIPEDGARIYFTTVIEENGVVVEDADISNDFDYVKIISLLEKNLGKTAITSMMQATNGQTIIQVDVLNNSMNEIRNGNIVVNLRNENGGIVETKQIRGSNIAGGKLLTIKGEETQTFIFNFDIEGASFDVSYIEAVLEEDDKPSKDSGKDKADKTYVNLFKDVNKTDWFYEAVRFVVENGMMRGTGKEIFEPGIPLTRGMLVTVLHRLENEPLSEKSSYVDVEEGKYYSEAISWAQQNGIIMGISDTEFGPERNITREQLVTILYRYAIYRGYDVEIGEELFKFKDSSLISDYALSAMQWAVGKGIIQGIQGKEGMFLAPSDNATRAETAAILHRFIKGMLP